MDILLANPRGFCAGVTRAITIVERALEKFGAPVYVRHEVVHNRFVCDRLRAKGAVFVEEVSDVPVGGTVVFSAHGVSKAVRWEAEARGLNIFDATCPLVTKVHTEVRKMREEAREVVMIGHRGHPEVEGTMGQCDSGIYLVEKAEDAENLVVDAPERLSYVTQTTLSVNDARVIIDALQRLFPEIHGPKREDICYATQNRQDAVTRLAKSCDVVIVVGSPNSSNSRRLQEVAMGLGVSAYLVDSAEQLDPQWFSDKRQAGVTAGASAPEDLVTAVVERLARFSGGVVRELEGVREMLNFPLPKALINRF